MYAIAVYTENFEPLYSRWLQTLPEGFSPVVKKFDLTSTVFGFRTPSWYDSIEFKLNTAVEFLEGLQDGEVALVSDVDVIFLRTGRELLDVAEARFVSKPELDIWIMKEGPTPEVNAGFYFVRNSKKVRDFLKDSISSCRLHESNADQDFFNRNLSSRLVWEHIPEIYSAWGGYITDINTAIFHHAVCCPGLAEKINLQNLVINTLKNA